MVTFTVLGVISTQVSPGCNLIVDPLDDSNCVGEVSDDRFHVPFISTPPKPLFSYSSTVPKGLPATNIHDPISSYADIGWQYDAQTKKYLLSYSGTPAMLANGSQISAANVVVQLVNIYYGPYVEDAEGAFGVRAHFLGSGPLLVFRNGVEIKGTWKRSSETSPTQLLSSSGSTIKLQPGLTWVEITPSTVNVTTSGLSRK